MRGPDLCPCRFPHLLASRWPRVFEARNQLPKQLISHESTSRTALPYSPRSLAGPRLLLQPSVTTSGAACSLGERSVPTRRCLAPGLILPTMLIRLTIMILAAMTAFGLHTHWTITCSRRTARRRRWCRLKSLRHPSIEPIEEALISNTLSRDRAPPGDSRLTWSPRLKRTGLPCPRPPTSGEDQIPSWPPSTPTRTATAASVAAVDSPLFRTRAIPRRAPAQQVHLDPRRSRMRDLSSLNGPPRSRRTRLVLMEETVLLPGYVFSCHFIHPQLGKTDIHSTRALPCVPPPSEQHHQPANQRVLAL